MALIRTPAGCGLGDLSTVIADAQVRVDVRDKFGSLLSLYEQYLELPQGKEVWDVGTRRSYWLEEKVTKRLTNLELNSFMHSTTLYENNPNYNNINHGRTGLFLTRLMQVAYEHGETHFVLNMNGLRLLHSLGYRLTQKDDKKINVTIDGMVGHNCLANAIVGTANIENAGHNCLSNALVETSNIGTAGDWCLWNATVGTANVATVSSNFLVCAKDVGEVYTSDRYKVTRVKIDRTIQWKPGGGIHLVSADELAEKMLKSRGVV